MIGALATAAYVAAVAYIVIVRPIRKKARGRPEYVIRDGKIYRA